MLLIIIIYYVSIISLIDECGNVKYNTTIMFGRRSGQEWIFIF